MHLCVIIPCYNEEQNIFDVISEIPRDIPGIDKVDVIVVDDGSRDKTVVEAERAGVDKIVSHPVNRGLAATFQDGVDAALRLGADIIVNTDGDNHYDQSRIPELLEPILKKDADVVVGNRVVETLEHMPFANKYGNKLGSFFVRHLFGLSQDIDVSSGFRAYSAEAASNIFVFSSHTYTHETLLQALDQGFAIRGVDIPARKVTRKSRLISSIPRHIVRSLLVIVRIFLLYKPLRVFFFTGSLLFVVGICVVGRFLWFYFSGDGQGHIQSLILSAAILIIAFQVYILGFVASAIGWNRKLLERLLSQGRSLQ